MESQYLNNVFRTLGSTKHLYDQCLTYALRSNNVKFNQTFIQPNPNVPETFFVSWVPPGSLYRGTTECFTCTAFLAQIPGISPALFLSLDTESINFDHHLRCCGCTVGTICEGKSTTVTHFYGCPLPHPTRPCPRMAHRSTPSIHVEKITILLNSRNVILARGCCSI